MENLFQNYKIVVLDSSFFVSEFSESFQESLKCSYVYIAGTFRTELNQYKKILPLSKKNVYNKNIDFIDENISVRSLDFKSFSLDAVSSDNVSEELYDLIKNIDKIHNDIWGLVTLLEKLKAKFVLATANQLLIQKVVLNNINVDIFNLNSNTFIYSKNFSQMSKWFELDNTEAFVATESYNIASENSVLYLGDGTRIMLAEEVGFGAEATIFKVDGRDEWIAKIFKKEKLSVKKFKNLKNLQRMNKLLDVTWALFPADILYYDSELSVPAGFVENYIEVDESLGNDALYLGGLDQLDGELKTHVSSSIEICLKIVRQIKYLNNYGFFISDFNLDNFAFKESDDTCIHMWDTDSFGYASYFSGYCDGNETSRKYNREMKSGAIDYCCEELYLFVFTVLSLGDPPISPYTFKFKYDNENYPSLARKEFFPDNLWSLFEQVFRQEKLPSVEVLLQQLEAALEDCRSAPYMDRTYNEIINGYVEPEIDEEDEPEIPPEKPKLKGWVKAMLAVDALLFAGLIFTIIYWFLSF